jgi:hypothetical protein
MLNRDGLNILLHPSTGDAYSDHTDHALWFGGAMPLRLDVLRKAYKTPGVLRVMYSSTPGGTTMSRAQGVEA